jgi:hypothetical protein
MNSVESVNMIENMPFDYSNVHSKAWVIISNSKVVDQPRIIIQRFLHSLNDFGLSVTLPVANA